MGTLHDKSITQDISPVKGSEQLMIQGHGQAERLLLEGVDLKPFRPPDADLIELAKSTLTDRIPPKEEDPPDKEDPAGDTTIPAGFTYFGQFVDHDITFDPTLDFPV